MYKIASPIFTNPSYKSVSQNRFTKFFVNVWLDRTVLLSVARNRGAKPFTNFAKPFHKIRFTKSKSWWETGSQAVSQAVSQNHRSRKKPFHTTVVAGTVSQNRRMDHLNGPFHTY